jgi:hypothetical protein
MVVIHSRPAAVCLTWFANVAHKSRSVNRMKLSHVSVLPKQILLHFERNGNSVEQSSFRSARVFTWSQNALPLMKSGGSLMSSQELADIDYYPELHECCPYLSTAVHTCLYLSPAVHTCLYLSITVHSCPYLSILVHTCPYLSTAVYTCPHLSTPVHTCSYLPTAVYTCPQTSIHVQSCPYLSTAVYNVHNCLYLCMPVSTCPQLSAPVHNCPYLSTLKNTCPPSFAIHTLR